MGDLKRKDQMLAMLVGASIAAVAIAAISGEFTPRVKLVPPDLRVRFHDDGQVSVYNPGPMPEVHVSLCVYAKGVATIEQFETPVLAGYTGVLGPATCAQCEQFVVLGPVCDDGMIVATHNTRPSIN